MEKDKIAITMVGFTKAQGSAKSKPGKWMPCDNCEEQMYLPDNIFIKAQKQFPGITEEDTIHLCLWCSKKLLELYKKTRNETSLPPEIRSTATDKKFDNIDDLMSDMRKRQAD